MPNGKPGDHVEWREPPHVPGDRMVADIVAGRHLISYPAEDLVREIVSFADPHEVKELADLLESMCNGSNRPHAAEVLRAVRRLRDRLREARGA